MSANVEFTLLKLLSAPDRGVQPVPAGGHRRAVGEVRAQDLPQGAARGDGDMVSFILLKGKELVSLPSTSHLSVCPLQIQRKHTKLLIFSNSLRNLRRVQGRVLVSFQLFIAGPGYVLAIGSPRRNLLNFQARDV